MNEEDRKIVDETPFDETEINYEQWISDANESLDGKSVDELKSTIIGLARRLGHRHNESRKLAQDNISWSTMARLMNEANRELMSRTLTAAQIAVGKWRKAAYPDTMQIELQALGVAEEAGELCHAVLKFKQGIRGYDIEKTRVEVADAIGDIVIYAMGVADHLGINVEQAVYETVQHVIKRNITQGSDPGQKPLTEVHSPAELAQAKIKDLSVRKFAKGDRVLVVGGQYFVGRSGTVHPGPGVNPYHSPTHVLVMLDGKDSPWGFHPNDLEKIEPIEDATTRVKGVDYAGHVPSDEDPHA